jgi:hypothetical protein
MADALQEAAVRRIAYLASVAPVRPQNSPFAHEWEPSPADLSALRIAKEALSSPDALLLLAQKGALIAAHVEAVAAATPELLGDIRVRALEAIARMDKPPSYAAQQQLAILLGQDMNGSLAQTSANQAAYVQGDGEKSPPPPRRESASAQSERHLTDMQRLESP